MTIAKVFEAKYGGRPWGLMWKSRTMSTPTFYYYNSKADAEHDRDVRLGKIEPWWNPQQLELAYNR